MALRFFFLPFLAQVRPRAARNKHTLCIARGGCRGGGRLGAGRAPMHSHRPSPLFVFFAPPRLPPRLPVPGTRLSPASVTWCCYKSRGVVPRLSRRRAGRAALGGGAPVGPAATTSAGPFACPPRPASVGPPTRRPPPHWCPNADGRGGWRWVLGGGRGKSPAFAAACPRFFPPTLTFQQDVAPPALRA